VVRYGGECGLGDCVYGYAGEVYGGVGKVGEGWSCGGGGGGVERGVGGDVVFGLGGVGLLGRERRKGVRLKWKEGGRGAWCGRPGVMSEAMVGRRD